MFVTYHRVGRLAVLPALAAVAAALLLAGVAAVVLVIVATAACAMWFLRALGRIGRSDRRVPARDPDTIDGVVLHSAEVSDQLDRLDGDKG